MKSPSSEEEGKAVYDAVIVSSGEVVVEGLVGEGRGLDSESLGWRQLISLQMIN